MTEHNKAFVVMESGTMQGIPPAGGLTQSIRYVVVTPDNVPLQDPRNDPGSTTWGDNIYLSYPDGLQDFRDKAESAIHSATSDPDVKVEWLE